MGIHKEDTRSSGLTVARAPVPGRDDAVVIRRLRREDSALLYRWWNDPAVMGQVGFPNGLELSRDEVDERVFSAVEGDGVDASRRRFIIESERLGGPIGELNYSRWDRRNRKVSIGIKICEMGAQRRGYGGAALRCLITYLFENLGINKIELDTLARNRPARHLYEKTGFREVGVKRQDYFQEATRTYEDVVLFELMRSAWTVTGDKTDVSASGTIHAGTDR